MSWVVVTNTNICRIYDYTQPQELTLLKTLEHPENKLKDSEIVADKPGHYKSQTTNRGAYTQRTDPKENEINVFAREIAQELEAARKTNHCNSLIIIAETRMLGLLNQHLDKNTKKLIRNRLQKDLPNISIPELIDFLHTHAQFSDPV